MADNPQTTIRSLPSVIAEARDMQLNGQYINGAVFHAMADEIDHLRATIKHIYGAATEDVPGARTAAQSNAEALAYIARHIEGVMPDVY